jgi:hypothetical protein
MLRNSAGFNLPSYFSGISGLNVREDGQRTCHSSRVKAGHPSSKGRYPPSSGAGSSTSGPLRLSYWRWVSRRRSIVARAPSPRLSSWACRWSQRARGPDEAIETSSGSRSHGSDHGPCAGCRGGDCTMGLAPSARPSAWAVVIAWGGRGRPARCDPPTSAKPIRL